MSTLFKTVLLVILTLALCGCHLQNRFLYFPSITAPSAAQLQAGGLELWGATQSDYRGLIALTPPDTPQGTVVVFHGNGGTAGWRGLYIKELSRFGLRVILAEYPQYGGRPGKLGEESFVRDGVETVRQATAQYGRPLYLLGESLGCGVVGGVVRQIPETVDGVILVTPWDSLPAVARRHYPSWLVRLLLVDSYDNVANLAPYHGPVAVVGAAADEVIPVEHAATLYASLPGPDKRFWLVAGGRHNDWPRFAPPSLWLEIVTFVAPPRP